MGHSRVIGTYERSKILGEGRFANVYFAVDPQGQLQQEVVIKILRKGCENRQDMRRAFRVESELLRKMQGHPYVPKLIHSGEHMEDGGKRYPYMVFEPLPTNAKSLQTIIGEHGSTDGERGMLLEEEALKILIQCCEVLKYTHDKSIVYWELKPEHIFWDGSAIKLIDWNVSFLVSHDDNKWKLFQKDLFRLGALAYYIVTGNSPAQPTSSIWMRKESDKGCVHDVNGRENVPWPIDFGPYDYVLSEEIKKIIRKAVYIDPEQRYTRAEVMCRELKNIPPIPHNRNQHIKQGKDFICKGQYDDAYNEINLAVDDDPDDDEGLRLLTWIRLAKKQKIAQRNSI